MAFKLTSKPNTEGVSAEYPYGNIKDNTGSNNGTPVNKLVYADMHQFFEKLMADAGIAHNDLPDNATNGFQLVLALLEVIKDTIDDYVDDYVDISGALGYNANLGSVNVVARRYKTGRILFRINANITGNILASSDLITGLPTTMVGGQYITGAFWKNPLTGNPVILPLDFNGGAIRTDIAINTATYDRLNIYLLAQIE